MLVRTTVYVDGYNFYYSCCKETPHKWVNPKAVAELLLPGHKITKVYFFTAAVKPEPHDPSKRQRQHVYWRALRTVPEIAMVEGHFLETVKRLPWVGPKFVRAFRRWICKWPMARHFCRPILVQVKKTEEKASDVNLATQLLLDAFDDEFDCAVVISNDSDLLAPIKTVRERFGKKVGLLTGHIHPSQTLARQSDFTKIIRPSILAAAQFPSPLVDRHGAFHKPPSWCR